MPEVAPEKFAGFLAGTVLRDISIWEAHVTRGGADPDGERSYGFGEDASLVSAERSRAIIHATYGIRVFDGDKEAVTMEVTMRAVYETPSKITDAIYEQFRKVTLRVHTIPFAREWFRDISGRMGIEPVLLPLALAHPAAMPKAAMPKAAKPKARKATT